MIFLVSGSYMYRSSVNRSSLDRGVMNHRGGVNYRGRMIYRSGMVDRGGMVDWSGVDLSVVNRSGVVNGLVVANDILG